jgi:hypothetical protein
VRQQLLLKSALAVAALQTVVDYKKLMLLHAAKLYTLTAAVKRRCALAAAWFASRAREAEIKPPMFVERIFRM